MIPDNNSTPEKHRGPGRPVSEIKKKSLRVMIDEGVDQRLEGVLKGRNRGKFVGNALTILLDIYEGKRYLPEAIVPEKQGEEPEAL